MQSAEIMHLFHHLGVSFTEFDAWMTQCTKNAVSLLTAFLITQRLQLVHLAIMPMCIYILYIFKNIDFWHQHIDKSVSSKVSRYIAVLTFNPPTVKWFMTQDQSHE